MFTEFSWQDAIVSSPIFMVLIACSIFTLGVIVERALYFHRRRGNPDLLLATSLKRIHQGDLKEAGQTCEATDHPVGLVAGQVFEALRLRGEPLEERLQVSLSQQKMLLERNLGVLGTMAAIAPLIGLLGTVWGIMRAFQNMALTGSSAPPVVAAGLAEALLTTAAGIIIAVPAILFYNHFNQRLNGMLTVAENHARTLKTALLEAGVPSGPWSRIRQTPTSDDDFGELRQAIAQAGDPRLPEVSGVR